MSHVAQIPSRPTAAADCPGFDRLWHPRGTLCAVCISRTHGFGWFDPNKPRGQRTYRWFCSMQCQSTFTRNAKRGMSMVDFTEEETRALPAVMRALAPEMERIGWDRSLGQLSQNDMQQLIVITVEAFRSEMFEIASQLEVPF